VADFSEINNSHLCENNGFEGKILKINKSVGPNKVL
jgi:hypothetical protein